MRYSNTGIAAVAIALPFAVLAQNAGQSATDIRTLHIEVTSQSGNRFSPGNFVVSQGPAQYTVTMSRPATKQSSGVPTHILIIMSRPMTSMPLSAAARLREIVDRGWWVKVIDSDGRATPYIQDESALDQVLAIRPSASSTDAAIQAGPPDTRSTSALPTALQLSTVQELAAFPGRRVLIVMGGALRRSYVAQAGLFISETYFAIGLIAMREIDARRDERSQRANTREMLGEEANGQPEIDLGCINGTASDHGASVNSIPCIDPLQISKRFGTTQPDRETVTSNPAGSAAAAGMQPRTVATIEVALDETVAAAGDYYDLEVRVPDAALQAPFTLTFHRVHGRAQGRADMYLVSAGPGGMLLRQSLNDKLVLKD